MEDNMERTSVHHGSLIAFEGASETVSTQLRLLPSSSKILVLPALQYFMKAEDTALPFDAASYILKVHEACLARVDMARSFLRESSPDNKRLVFMNGGTASAVLKCITAISQREAHGDTASAEGIFKDLVRNGVAGLKRRTEDSSLSASTHSADNGESNNEGLDSLPNDPGSKAMRAADALDRETAALQPNNDIDLTTASRCRSMSVPMRRIVDDFEDAAPFYVFGGPSDHESRSAPWRLDVHGHGNGDVEMAPPSYVEEANMKSPSASALGMPSPSAVSAFDSMPNTPAVMYGEACLVDVLSSQSPPTRASRSHKKVKSVDRIYASAIHNQDISLCTFYQPMTPSSPGQTHTSAIMMSPPEAPERQILRSEFCSENTRATLAKPSKAMIRRVPPSPLDFSRNVPFRSLRPSTYIDKGTSPKTEYVDKATWVGSRHVDRGADAEDTQSSKADYCELYTDAVFEAVLPMVEDLLIHFKDEVRDMLLESVIGSFKNGSYQVSMNPLPPACHENADVPGTSISGGSASFLEQLHVIEMQTRLGPAHQAGDDEYDPFNAFLYECLNPAASLKSPQSWPVKRTPTEPTTAVVSPAPPTPAQTPPPMTITDRNFHDFSTSNCRTAVCIQNSLRSILSLYFPPNETGYRQCSFPQLPELSNLWKPVFRDAEPNSPKKEKRKVDLILAIGAQKGVNREFLSSISGSLEKLGTKPNGVTRSGRLDLRYLIANAMQAFTAQPLTNQTQDNPFSNTLLLATLIIPHLETYMAAHSDTRFLLLEYPPQHLATVLAMQRLVGVDLLKVAGILSAESPDSKLSSRSPMLAAYNGSHSNANSVSRASVPSSRTAATLLAPTGAKSLEAPSFAKANFLITSSASDSEIYTLISTIWKMLIDISQFYIPEGAQRPSTSYRTSSRDSEEKSPDQDPLISPASEYAPLVSAAVMMGFHTPPVSPSQTLAAMEKDMPPPPPPSAETPVKLLSSKASISETIKSFKTAKSLKHQKPKIQQMLGEKADLDSDKDLLLSETGPSYFDISDDENGQFAADERKYTPLYLKNSAVRKGNSRKALMWLGLT